MRSGGVRRHDVTMPEVHCESNNYSCVCAHTVTTEIRILTQFIIARQEVKSLTWADVTECVRRVGADTVGFQPSSFILKGWSVVSDWVFCGLAYDCTQYRNGQTLIYLQGSNWDLNLTFTFAAHAHVRSVLECAGVWGFQMSHLPSKYLRFAHHMFTHLPRSASPTRWRLLLSYPPSALPLALISCISVIPRWIRE